MLKKIFIGIAVLIIACISLTYYFLRSSNIETLMTCSTNPHVVLVPESLCKYYTLHFRGNKQDIASLESTSGLSFIFANKLQTSYFLDFLVKKGINLNKVSPLTGNTPLSSAVVFNKPDLVKYLLAHGADPSIKTNDDSLGAFNHHTPLEIAEMMQKNKMQPDRSEVIQILKEHK